MVQALPPALAHNWDDLVESAAASFGRFLQGFLQVAAFAYSHLKKVIWRFKLT